MCPVPNWVMVFGLCVHPCSFFVLYMVKLSKPISWVLNMAHWTVFVSISSVLQRGRSLILVQMLQSAPYPQSYAGSFYPIHCIIGNLLNAFLPKSVLKVLTSFEYIPTWHNFRLLVKFCGSPKIKKIIIKKEKAR